MRVGNFTKAVAVAATVAWMAGCSTTDTTSDSGETMDKGSQQQDSASSSGTGSDGQMQSGQMADKMGKDAIANLQTVFYFDFDKAVVRPVGFEDLSAHAKYLADNPSARVVLEGHADERGTREYNIALGERRAKAVSRFLTVQGAASEQIEVVSYGEERPADTGSNEAAWSKNRRVELKYSR
ncbi:peptidoglycan-associated lipoprotein Pal [Motiliproteus sp.]|uniref:peptidoglycan-associated lipoprotein Pal n=1 Tax=Motiliproteus sp. TaxID=1898955 RepID=UPI003BA9D053